MNLHMPQDPESESELLNLAAVPYQIISPSNNAPIIGIYQDSMVGSFQFTRDTVHFTQREAMNLLMMFPRVNATKLQSYGDIVTSFNILSQIMPPFSIKMKNKLFGEKDDPSKSNNVVEVKNGEYLRGQIDKGIFAGGGLIQKCCNDFGNLAAAAFIDDLQNIVTEYMKCTAFSVGISDLITNQATNDTIVKIVTEKKNAVKNLIDQIQIGVFENNSGKTNEQEFETQVDNILKKATAETGKECLKNLQKDNRFVVMSQSGSKGSDLNITFMAACLGQQNIDGKRIPYGFEHRTLPHYTKYDDTAIARGFVESSYINGLTPQELFFHAMGGRVGLIDTAVKTSSTGYIQRRLIKGLEDLMVGYDMTIRTSKNKVVQFSYGDDNIDTIKVENQELRLTTMSIQDIYAHYNTPQDDLSSKQLSLMFMAPTVTRFKKQMPELTAKCKFYTEFMIAKRNEIVKCVFGNKDEKIVRAPVGFAHLIGNVVGQQNLGATSLVDITPLEAFELIEFYYSQLEKLYYVAPTQLFKTLYYFYLSPKDLLFVKRFNRVALTILLENITLNYKRAVVAPGEMVGMIAAQSIGEPTTQMTLNSVTYETEIIVRDSNGVVKKMQIGDFIENKISVATKKEHYQDKDTTYAEVDDFYEIPSCTEDGDVLWKRVEAVTRHPVINADGTNTMLKVTTKEQREVIVTKAKSLLKLINGKISPVNGADLKVGDYLPVSKKHIDFTETRTLDLQTVLLPTEYIYSSEIDKAKTVMHETRWWTKHQGTTFTLPYKRSDSFVAKVSDKLRAGCNSKTAFAPGCVYTKQTNMNDYRIPEILPLDYNLGYLVGAYAAEGCMTRFQVSISNNDEKYFAPIVEFCEKHNLTTKVYRHEDKNNPGWTSQDIRIYNTVLCRLLEHFCGKLSHNKFVSNEIIFSNRECLLGFMDAYIGGDGYVNVNGENRGPVISMASVSKQLLIDVQQILNILGCYSKIYTSKKQETNNRGSQNIKQLYNLFVRNQQAQKLAHLLKIKLEYKQENLKQIIAYKYQFEYSRKDECVPDEVDGVVVMTPRTEISNCLDVYFDEVKSIEEIPNTTNYAYDLTIEDTRNFNIYNGLCLRDTFHFAGVSSKSNVTRGVPRIEEILSLSSEPKNPLLTVYLKPEDETDRAKAQSIMYMLEHTNMREVVQSVDLCFDPDELSTLIEEDQTTMEQYKRVEDILKECAEDDTADETVKSKWVIRMEMDAEVMLEKNITMDDIHFTLNHSFGNEISCIYSDYNASKLVFRIRMNEVLSTSRNGQKKTKIASLDQSDQIYVLKNFQEQMLDNVVLRGIKGIEKVVLRKIKDNVVETAGAFKQQEIWVLDGIGTNMLDVLALDYIDNTRTYSNHIIEIFNILGIEAARQAIYNELVEVLEFDSAYINFHHLSLLCDRMTYTYKLISIFRHGINNDNIGPIAKASFEETPKIFLDAAQHADLDIMRGISANVMCGQEGFYGTSAFQVILDIAEMTKQQAAQVKLSNENDELEKLLSGMSIAEEVNACSTESLTIKNDVANIKSVQLGEDNDYNPGF
jgi:DNA-directed RNA polymerase beta' subunit